MPWFATPGFATGAFGSGCPRLHAPLGSPNSRPLEKPSPSESRFHRALHATLSPDGVLFTSTPNGVRSSSSRLTLP